MYWVKYVRGNVWGVRCTLEKQKTHLPPPPQLIVLDVFYYKVHIYLIIDFTVIKAALNVHINYKMFLDFRKILTWKKSLFWVWHPETLKWGFACKWLRTCLQIKAGLREQGEQVARAKSRQGCNVERSPTPLLVPRERLTSQRPYRLLRCKRAAFSCSPLVSHELRGPLPCDIVTGAPVAQGQCW